jgi:hypothetical protein
VSREGLWSKCPRRCNTCRCHDISNVCRQYIGACHDLQVRYNCRRTCQLCLPNNNNLQPGIPPNSFPPNALQP